MSYAILQSYYAASASELQKTSSEAILGKLVTCRPFAIDEKQRYAWQVEIGHLQEISTELINAFVFLEFIRIKRHF
jgi:hypothetical protein